MKAKGENAKPLSAAGGEMTRSQKITLGEMRASGVRDLLVYCTDHHCSHWIKVSADQWPHRLEGRPDFSAKQPGKIHG